MIIVELSSVCRRQPAVGGADSSVGPVTHIISPDHSLQIFHSVVLRLVFVAVEQLFFHSCPHTFTACIIMTSSASAVHALNDPIFLYSSSVLFACILTAPVRMYDTAFYIRIWFVCVFKSMAAERSSHIIFNSYPQRHQIKAVKYRWNIELSILCLHLAHVGHSFFQRPVCVKITSEKIIRFLSKPISFGYPVWLSARLVYQSYLRHDLAYSSFTGNVNVSFPGSLSLLQCKIHTLPAVAVIILVFFVDLHHFICKCLILPGGVFMAEMIIKCLSCNLQSLAVKTDTSCDPTVISLFGNEL